MTKCITVKYVNIQGLINLVKKGEKCRGPLYFLNARGGPKPLCGGVVGVAAIGGWARVGEQVQEGHSVRPTLRVGLTVRPPRPR